MTEQHWHVMDHYSGEQATYRPEKRAAMRQWVARHGGELIVEIVDCSEACLDQMKQPGFGSDADAEQWEADHPDGVISAEEDEAMARYAFEACREEGHDHRPHQAAKLAPSEAEGERTVSKPTAAQRTTDAFHVLRRMAGGARLWDTLGLHGAPGLEDPNHDLEKVRRSTFNDLVARGWVVLDRIESTGAVFGLTDLGRDALDAHQEPEFTPSAVEGARGGG